MVKASSRKNSEISAAAAAAVGNDIAALAAAPAAASMAASPAAGPMSAAPSGLRSRAAQAQMGPIVGTPCVGCEKKFPVLDRNGEPICVGDTVRVQGMDGRTAEWVMREADWTHGSNQDPNTPFGVNANPRYDRERNALICFEVGESLGGASPIKREAWAEVIAKADPATVGKPYVIPPIQCPDEFPASLYHYGKGAGRALTPVNAPGFNEAERRVLTEVLEAGYCLSREEEVNRGLPALRSNIDSEQVRLAQRAREANGTFVKRWGRSPHEAQVAHDCLRTQHPLAERLYKLKWEV